MNINEIGDFPKIQKLHTINKKAYYANNFYFQKYPTLGLKIAENQKICF